MNIITKKLIELIFQDFYDLERFDHPAFGEELAKLKKKKKLTGEPPAKYRKMLDIETHHVDRFVYYVVRSKTKQSGRRVVYIHGGGFFAEAFTMHWAFCARLIEKTGCEIIFPVYPLVPESSTVECHEMLLTLYRELLGVSGAENSDSAENIASCDLILMGDSAGGTLCLSLSMMARDLGLPLAKELILISPGFGINDMTEEEKARFTEIQKHDFMIGKFPIRKIAELWNGGAPLDYRTDVTLGSYEGLPMITVFSGTYDIMNIPARRFAARLEKEGRPYRYIEKEGGYHVYVLDKKAKDEFELICEKVGGTN